MIWVVEDLCLFSTSSEERASDDVKLRLHLFWNESDYYMKYNDVDVKMLQVATNWQNNKDPKSLIAAQRNHARGTFLLKKQH